MAIRRNSRPSRAGKGNRLALSLAAAAVPLVPRFARAGTDNYVGTSGNWTDGTKWSTAAPPNPGDAVTLTNNGSSGVTVTFNPTASTGTGLASLTLAAINSGFVQLTQQQGNPLTVAGSETVGSAANGTGILQMFGATHTVGVNLVLGSVAGGTGQATVSVGSLSVGGTEIIGSGGSGSVTQTSGTNSAGNLTLASGTSSDGTYTLTGGTLSVSGDEKVGISGDASFSQAGATHIVGGTLTISAGTGTGSYTIFSGTLDAGAIQVNVGGTFSQLNGGTISPTTFTQSGGSVAGILVSQGTFVYNAGAFPGRLVNQGSVTLNADPVFGNGVENDSSMTIAVGRTVTANGGGFLNVGTLTVTGGTIVGSSFANDFGGLVNARGTIAAPFANKGTINTTGLLTVNSPASNAGTINVGTGETFRMATGVGFTNSGTLNLGGGAFTGGNGFVNAPVGVVNLSAGGALGSGGTVTNSAGATLQGYGSIASPVINSGLIYANTSGQTLTVSTLSGTGGGGELRVAEGATLGVVSPFASGGLVALQGANAHLTGGTVTNTGTISGVGRVSNPVLNVGVVRAEGGQLTMAGAGNTNPPGGSVQAPAGATIFYSQGLASNGGTIALSGGTFDNNNQPMLNTGSILGSGTFRSGGLTNTGTVSFADSATGVLGPVTNNSGGKINVTSNTTTFFGPVTNNAGGTIKTTSATARFLAPFTNNGVFSSDPADNSFSTLNVGATGALVGGAGDRFFVTGDLLNASRSADAWDTRAAELHLSGAPAHLLTSPGEDLGPSADGYTRNFAWGLLELARGESLTISDGDSKQGAAVYVGDLLLDGGLEQLPLIDTGGPDVVIYYDRDRPANAYLAGRTYPLSGGGTLAPVPEPGGLLPLAGACSLLLCSRRRRGGPQMTR